MDGTTLLMRRLSTLWICQCKKVREWGSLAGRQKRETIASVVAAENIDMRKTSRTGSVPGGFHVRGEEKKESWKGVE